MFRRLTDIVVSLTLLVLISPIMAVLAVGVLGALGRPVLFRQRRAGRNAKPFTLLKFRTMREERSENGVLEPDETRLTSLGRYLRLTSLDEIPEFFNVLKGDMSLVGPRPLPLRYLERYSVTQARRHDIRPGITGWAQVNGRNATDWDTRLALDAWYVDNRSCLLDMKIIALTLWKVIIREGITQPGHATMEEFVGTEG